MPAIASSAVIAFLASFENYNTTVFSILSDQTLTTVIASKVRLGISPAISALALSIILLTLFAAIIYEILRRREDKKKRERQDQLIYEETKDSRLKKEAKKSFKLPKSIYVFILIFVVGIFGFNQLIKNGLYGKECVAAAEEAKKSNFSDQLKLLQLNAESVDEEALEGGELGGNKDYGDIFGDSNLFKDFGGFDSKEDDKEE